MNKRPAQNVTIPAISVIRGIVTRNVILKIVALVVTLILFYLAHSSSSIR